MICEIISMVNPSHQESDMIFKLTWTNDKGETLKSKIKIKRLGNMLKFITKEDGRPPCKGPDLDVSWVEDNQFETFVRRIWLEAIQSLDGSVQIFHRIK
jgi:hypothetical protein